MVNKAKKQGTNYETNIVNRLNKVENFKSQRFAEGGSKDLGDIQLFADNEEYFIEAKSRQNLNLHQSLEKAIEKSNNVKVFFGIDNQDNGLVRLHNASNKEMAYLGTKNKDGMLQINNADGFKTCFISSEDNYGIISLFDRNGKLGFSQSGQKN